MTVVTNSQQPSSAKRNLVFSSVGKRNRIESWNAGAVNKEFDTVIYYFEDGETPDFDAKLLVRRKGLKFENFFHFYQTGALEEYDAVWIVDDDIVMDTASVNTMFSLFRQHRLLLAQPSFNRRCKRPFRITFTHPDYLLRFTNFVENGVALFSTHILDQLKETFRDAGTGFGVDFLWPSILGFPKDKIAVIDAVNCMHPNDQGSSLDKVVPRPLHKIQGIKLLIEYGLLPGDADVPSDKFSHPYQVREFSGIRC